MISGHGDLSESGVRGLAGQVPDSADLRVGVKSIVRERKPCDSVDLGPGSG